MWFALSIFLNTRSEDIRETYFGIRPKLLDELFINFSFIMALCTFDTRVLEDYPHKIVGGRALRGRATAVFVHVEVTTG